MANEQKVLTEITQNVMETEQTVNKKKSVAYIFNDEYLKLCSQLPKVENRVRLNCFSGISSNSEISTLSICVAYAIDPALSPSTVCQMLNLR